MLAPEAAILRLFNVYGPGQTGPYAGVVSKFIERAKSGPRSSTATIRDFIHVADVTRLVEVVLERGAADVSKARALGWEPKVPLEEGLRRLWTLTSSLR